MNRPWSSSSSSFVSFFALGGRTPQCTSYTDRTLGLLGFLLPFFTQPCAIQIPHFDKLWPKQFTIRETQRMYDERGWSCGVLSCHSACSKTVRRARSHTHTLKHKFCCRTHSVCSPSAQSTPYWLCLTPVTVRAGLFFFALSSPTSDQVATPRTSCGQSPAQVSAQVPGVRRQG